MTKSVRLFAFLLTSNLIFALLATAHQAVNAGPPAEIRGHIDTLISALNSGDSGQWEKMAQAHFSTAELNRHSPEARKQVFDLIRRDFGTISLRQVDGPDQPLRLHITGSSGATGVIELKLEPNVPYRIEDLKLIPGDADRDAPGVRIDPPPVNGNMPNEQLASALDAYLSGLAASDVFSGNVLVAKDGKTIYERSYNSRTALITL